MKSFNKQIQITVELDTIANSLLSTLSPEAKHRDIIVESIIGRLASKNDTQGMTALYNALNGFSNEINFKVGDIVNCSRQEYGYWTEESRTNNDTVNRELGIVKVIEIDEYSDKKLKIEYNCPSRSGENSLRTIWVDHSYCTKTPGLVLEETSFSSVKSVGKIDLRKQSSEEQEAQPLTE